MLNFIATDLQLHKIFKIMRVSFFGDTVYMPVFYPFQDITIYWKKIYSIFAVFTHPSLIWSTWAIWQWKLRDHIVTSFESIPACDGQTVGRMDTLPMPMLCSSTAKHDKNQSKNYNNDRRTRHQLIYVMSLLTETTEQSVVYFHQAVAQPRQSNNMLVTTCIQNSPQCQNMLAVQVVCSSQQNRMLQLSNSKTCQSPLRHIHREP